jgi:putative intracellular protease/amidase
VFDAAFYPGGHGPLWDLAENDDSLRLIEALYAEGKPVAAVCHGPAALRDARDPYGLPLVRGKAVTGFSDSEERAAGLAGVVPFMVEDALKEAGGVYSSAADWQAHVVSADNLITGQNPASSTGAARAVLQRLQQPAQAAA